MFCAAHVHEAVQDAKHYGFDINIKDKFQWKSFKEKRDAYVKRLNGIYTSNIGKDNIQYIEVRCPYLVYILLYICSVI